MNQKSPPALNTTATVIALMTVIAALHVARILLSPERATEYMYAAGFAPSEFLAALSGADWGFRELVLASPITHAFVHADFFHLGLNVAFLLAFGTAIDRRVGSVRFIGLFLACVLAGAAATMLVYLLTGGLVIIVGASGGVSGLFGAFVRFGLRQRTTAIVVFIGINIVLAFTGFSSFGETRAIAWDAHIGGFLAGLLLFPLFDRRATWPPQWQ